MRIRRLGCGVHAEPSVRVTDRPKEIPGGTPLRTEPHGKAQVDIIANPVTRPSETSRRLLQGSGKREGIHRSEVKRTEMRAEVRAGGGSCAGDSWWSARHVTVGRLRRRLRV